jgi:hypothetical protein
MNTVEKTSTGVTLAELILSHSIRLSSHILTPVHSDVISSEISLSGRLDEWISRQHTLLTVVQEHLLQTDQHKVVENDPDVTDYPVNSYVLYTSPMGRSNKLLPKHKRKEAIHLHNLRPFT